jgi:hypothetical protein
MQILDNNIKCACDCTYELSFRDMSVILVECIGYFNKISTETLVTVNCHSYRKKESERGT